MNPSPRTRTPRKTSPATPPAGTVTPPSAVRALAESLAIEGDLIWSDDGATLVPHVANGVTILLLDERIAGTIRYDLDADCVVLEGYSSRWPSLEMGSAYIHPTAHDRINKTAPVDLVRVSSFLAKRWRLLLDMNEVRAAVYLAAEAGALPRSADVDTEAMAAARLARDERIEAGCATFADIAGARKERAARALARQRRADIAAAVGGTPTEAEEEVARQDDVEAAADAEASGRDRARDARAESIRSSRAPVNDPIQG